MITILSEPQNTPVDAVASVDPKGVPVPVTDCFKWCLQLDDADAVTTAGIFATVVVSFPNTTTVVSPGTPFKIWGRDFTVNNSINFTSTSFKTVTLGRTTASNFADMIRANLFFGRETTVTINDTGSAYVVTITWNTCREQPNFTPAGMSFLGVTATGATATYTNGVSPVYVDGVKVVTQLINNDGLDNPVPVSEFEGHEPDRLCDSVAPVCVDYRTDIEGQLYTILPELTLTSFTTPEQNGQSLMRVFQLNYGWMYREDCVSKSGTFMRSGYVVGINAAFPPNDPYQMQKYWYGHPDEFEPGQIYVKFLTSQPPKMRLCLDSYAWLWMTNNFSQEFGGEYILRHEMRAYKNGSSVAFLAENLNDGSEESNFWYNPYCLNVSPGRFADNGFSGTFDYYITRVLVQNLTLDETYAETEVLTYYVDNCNCATMTDIYFLTPPGGYATLPVQIISEEVNTDGTEVNLYMPCEWDFEKRNKQGGRTLVNLRNYQRKTVRASLLGLSGTDRRFFQEFVMSPSKYIKESKGAYDWARKIIVDPGTVQIFENGDNLEMTATVYFSDIQVQNPASQ